MLSFPTNKPLIVITMGDPSGIGPEIIMKALADLSKERFAVFVIVGDEGVMRSAAASFCDKPFAVKSIGDGFEEDAVNLVDPGPELKGVKAGLPTDDGARKTLSCLDAAVRIVRDAPEGVPRAMVTAPVSKERIARLSPGFVGHTEYLQKAFSSRMVTMAMVGKHFTVIPVTRHIPLSEVPGKLTTQLIVDTISQVVESRYLLSGKDGARIGVAALNPHGGEGGRIGEEEIDIIKPAVDIARSFYGEIEGPLPADVIFYKAFNKEIDIVVSMYHDQCLAPFKMVDFATGVNTTLGLGCVRTSPDHGTAFDIAGKGLASSTSMEEAIRLAARAVKAK